MLADDRYFRDLTEEELWQRYCGFLALSSDEFMRMQKELLLDQIMRICNSTLGKKIMGTSTPASVQEFRDRVPLTSYDDYQPYLSERRDDALAEKPEFWCRSAGRGGQPKWQPFTLEFFEKHNRNAIGSFILACAKGGKSILDRASGFLVFSHLHPTP